MSTPDSNSYVFEPAADEAGAAGDVSQQIRDISEVPAIEVITTAAVHLMSAAAVKLGLAAEDNAEELKDLDARTAQIELRRYQQELPLDAARRAERTESGIDAEGVAD